MAKKIEAYDFNVLNLVLKNFKCYESFEIGFDKDYDVIVGANGAGKTAILDALALALSKIFEKLDDLKGHKIKRDYVRIKEETIANENEFNYIYPCSVGIGLETTHFTNDFIGYRSEVETSKSSEKKIPLISAIKYSEFINNSLKNGVDITLPILGFYGINRVSNDEASKFYRMEYLQKNRLDGYKNCFDSKTFLKKITDWFEYRTYRYLQEGNEDLILAAVQECVKNCTKEQFEGGIKLYYSVRYKKLVVEYINGGNTIVMPLSYMSVGIRSVVCLVADIIIRMSILNPNLVYSDICLTPGVILIDEIDMHLHPSWQKSIIADLKESFPNVQFIVTTHSPSVISNVPKEKIIILENFVPQRNTTIYTYGRKTDDILRDIFLVSEDGIVSDLKNSFYENLGKGKLEEAKKDLDKISEYVGENDEFIVKNKIKLVLEGYKNNDTY